MGWTSRPNQGMGRNCFARRVVTVRAKQSGGFRNCSTHGLENKAPELL
jgi:hypothetical protein